MLKNFSVDVIGDTVAEPDEEFRVNILNASVPIVASVTFATILHDDGEDPGGERRLFLPFLSR